MPIIPTIETDRLRLRPHRVADFEPYCGLWGDPDVVRFIGGVASTREQTWGRLMRATGHWHHMGFGFLIVEEKGSKRLIGEVGFHEARRAITPSLEGSLEAGWVIAPPFYGRGFAYEAMQAMLVWVDQAVPGPRVTAIIDPENRPSLSLAAKLGFHVRGRTEYNGTVVLLERPRISPR